MSPNANPPVAAGRRLQVDLEEDLATRWVPDVVADIDLPNQAQRPTLTPQDVRFVQVPKTRGESRSVPQLSGAALGQLHQAVEGLREVGHRLLAPTVCGYRAGAEGPVHYSNEYRRFRMMSAGEAESHAFVVMADIAAFFDSVTPMALDVARRHVGDLAAWTPVTELLKQTQKLGVSGLPAGYGDARLIANMILAYADSRLKVPFTRWVDDYRLFVDSKSEGWAALEDLAKALAPLGLRLNRGKSRILTLDEFRRLALGPSLDSVYHPQDESPAAVRANLRSVFLDSVARKDRRLLRFSLPRLAKEQDDFALSFVLESLSQAPQIDAPRMVAYLSTFSESPALTSHLPSLIDAQVDDGWNFLRIVPLLARTASTPAVVDRLAQRLEGTRSALQWGNLLRTLAIHDATEAVKRELGRLGSGVPDGRAAAVVAWELQLPVRCDWGAGVAPVMDSLEEAQDAPLPRVDSLL